MFRPERLLGRVALLCVLLPGLAHSQGFTSAVVVPVAGDPNVLATGDFNGDGNPDLVYQDAASGGNLHVLLGNGDGSFRAGQIMPLPAGVGGPANVGGVIDVGDLNGDGVPDIVLQSGSPEAVLVLLGKGDGTFASPIGSPTTTQLVISTHVAIADFDGDGHADIVFNDNSSNLHLMRGDGKGGLGAPSTFSAGIDGDVQTADLNGDGRPDLIVSGNVFLNQGNGTFSSPVSYAPISNSLAQKTLGLADINGDGRPDLIFGNSNLSGSTGQVMVAYGNGDGTFGAPTAVANTGPTIRQFFITGVADLNGDGRARVMIASSGAVAAVLGATPTNNPLYATSGFRAPQTLLADFNKDGCVDFAIPAENAIVILFGKPDGTFSGAVSQPTIGGESVVFADTNSDGTPDAILGLNRVYLGSGDGTFSNTMVQVSNGTDDPLYLADFNGDGKADLFSFQNVATGNGDGTFAAPQFLLNLAAYQYPFDGFPTTFAAIADFNHDGMSDIAAGFSANGTQGGSPARENVALALSSGGGNYTYAYLPLSERVGPIGAGDFDHDGNESELDRRIPCLKSC